VQIKLLQLAVAEVIAALSTIAVILMGPFGIVIYVFAKLRTIYPVLAMGVKV